MLTRPIQFVPDSYYSEAEIHSEFPNIYQARLAGALPFTDGGNGKFWFLGRDVSSWVESGCPTGPRPARTPTGAIPTPSRAAIAATQPSAADDQHVVDLWRARLDAIRERTGCDESDAVRTLTRGMPELHREYIDAFNRLHRRRSLGALTRR